MSPLKDGLLDADLQGLKLAFSQSCSTSTVNRATTSSEWPGMVSEQANYYRTGLQSHRSAGIPTGATWTASDVKGKGVAKSLDWHLATMASSDREREGSYIICSLGTRLIASLLTPLRAGDTNFGVNIHRDDV